MRDFPVRARLFAVVASAWAGACFAAASEGLSVDVAVDGSADGANVVVKALADGKPVPARLSVRLGGTLATEKDSALCTAESGALPGGGTFARIGRTDPLPPARAAAFRRPARGWVTLSAPAKAEVSQYKPWCGCRPFAGVQWIALAWPFVGETTARVAYDADVRAPEDWSRPFGGERPPPAPSAIGEAMAPFAGDGTNRMPGAVSAVADAEGRVTFDCVGYADLAAKRPMRPDSLFWIASNTKGVAAATFLTVVDEGKIGLDDPVAKHLPGFHAKVTVRQVLSHTSGLPFFFDMPIDDRPVSLLAQLAARTKLGSEPGTKYEYSNLGIDVAMAVMEAVTGEPFEKTMRKRILEPLGMYDTTFRPTAEQLARLVTFYRVDEKGALREKAVDQLTEPYDLDGRYPEAGGGLFSTPADMIRFFRMVAQGGVTPEGRRLISEASMAEWFRKQTPEGVADSYSFGMCVWPKSGTISHGGSGGTQGCANWKKKTAKLLFIQLHGDLPARAKLTDAWNGATKAY